jgi:hypothetical protein
MRRVWSALPPKKVLRGDGERIEFGAIAERMCEDGRSFFERPLPSSARSRGFVPRASTRCGARAKTRM